MTRQTSIRLSDLKPGSFSRVIVLGSSGSGKSTLAPLLAKQLGIPFIATDMVYWHKDWTAVSSTDVRAWLEMATRQSCWVTDGNFDAQRDLLWGRAELAVWLDLPWTSPLGACFAATSHGGCDVRLSGARRPCRCSMLSGAFCMPRKATRTSGGIIRPYCAALRILR